MQITNIYTNEFLDYVNLNTLGSRQWLAIISVSMVTANPLFGFIRLYWQFIKISYNWNKNLIALWLLLKRIIILILKPYSCTLFWALYCWLPVVVLASIVIFQVTLVSIKCLPSFCTQTGLHLDWTVRTVESNSFTVCYCVCSGMCWHTFHLLTHTTAHVKPMWQRKNI